MWFVVPRINKEMTCHSKAMFFGNDIETTSELPLVPGTCVKAYGFLFKLEVTYSETNFICAKDLYVCSKSTVL